MAEESHKFQRVFTALFVSLYSFLAMMIGSFPIIKTIASLTPNDRVMGFLLATIVCIVLFIINMLIAGFVVWNHFYERK